MMKSLRLISGLLSILVTAPIWYYLLHAILLAINADRLLMFLFWVYVPAGLLATALGKIAEGNE